MILDINYKLDLLPNIKIYLIFYINLLKLALLETLVQTTFYYKVEEEIEFKINYIENYKDNKLFRMYLIK
jgi:hypothetical protein